MAKRTLGAAYKEAKSRRRRLMTTVALAVTWQAGLATVYPQNYGYVDE